jgi:acyl-CoA reductase-like NAD-dependent aldehyde dehydrogenase
VISSATNIETLSNLIYRRLQENAAEILDVLNQVETYRTACKEFQYTANAFSNVAALQQALEGRVPLGDVAVFMPFNVPLHSFYLYVITPMLAGNHIRVHQSSATGWVVDRLIEFLLPDLEGLVEVPDCSRSRFINGVAYQADGVIITADWETSQEILRHSEARTAIIYQGAGVNPFVITKGADLESAIEAAVCSRLYNSGQDCCACDLFYIHQEVFDEFCEGLCRRVKRAVVGMNQHALTDVGPLTKPQNAYRLLTRLSQDAQARSLLPAYMEGAYMYPGVYHLPFDSELLTVQKFCPLFTVAAYESEAGLCQKLLTAEHRMIVSVFGEPALLRCLSPHYGHPLWNTIIYDVEDLHAPFGGYGKSSFVRRPYQKGLTKGPIWIARECTLPEAHL